RCRTAQADPRYRRQMPGASHADIGNSHRDPRGRLAYYPWQNETPMPAVARIDPKTVFTPEQWRHLTSRSSWRGLWLVAHAWGTIAACIVLVTLWPNPLIWLVAVMVVGTRQLGLAILMHEAAHGGLCASKSINEWVGQW